MSMQIEHTVITAVERDGWLRGAGENRGSREDRVEYVKERIGRFIKYVIRTDPDAAEEFVRFALDGDPDVVEHFIAYMGQDYRDYLN